MGIFAGQGDLPESLEKKDQRELERMLIYGDTRLPIEFAKELHDVPRFKLGSIARFLDRTNHIVECRYVRFSDGIPGTAQNRAVGQKLSTAIPWIATYDPSLSHPGMILGVPLIREAVGPGVYGWVLCHGILDLTGQGYNFVAGNTIYWHDTGVLSDNGENANGVVGIAMDTQVILVSPWFGMPTEASPPFDIVDVIGLEDALAQLASDIAELSVAFDPEGAWADDETILENQVWSHNGSSWIALQDSVNIEPGVDVGWEAYWMILAEKGNQGDQGIPGNDGNDGAPGVDGDDGAPGADGADGSVWHEGAADPAGGLGADTDFYLQSGTGATGVLGDVWVKAAGTWTIQLNIRGPSGAGAGDVVGPDGGVVDTEVALFDGATGKLLQGSGILLADLVTDSILTTALGDYTPTASLGTMAFETAADYVLGADLVTTLGGYVLKSLFNAHTILNAVSDDTPVALTVGEQTLVGRITGGNITALTPTQVRTLINVEDGADVTDATNVAAAGAIMDGDFSADGIMVRTGAGAYASRAIAVTASTGLSVTNGDGDAGNPTLAGIDATTSAKGVSEIATAAEYRTGTDTARTLGVAEVWGAALLAVLTDAATITVDLAAGFNFGQASNAPLALGGNRELGAPSNLKTGQTGILWFSASGSTRTLTLNAAWTLVDDVEAGPYSITTSQTLGVVYVVRNSTVYVIGIIRVG